MRTRSRFQLSHRLVAVGALVVGLLLTGFGRMSDCRAQSDDEELLPLEEMVRPTAEQLLSDPPRDWLVLTNDLVMVVEPVYPRPDTLKILAQKRKSRDRKTREAGKQIQIF